MVMQKKSLIGATSAKQKMSDSGSNTKSAKPAQPSEAKKLAVAKLAKAKLSTARLTSLKRLT